jgi:hypothetical protein
LSGLPDFLWTLQLYARLPSRIIQSVMLEAIG